MTRFTAKRLPPPGGGTAASIKWRRRTLAQHETATYITTCNNCSPVVRPVYTARQALWWALRLCIPDFLVGHPNLFDNLKTLFKHPHFRPLRLALIGWLIFTLTTGSLWAGLTIVTRAAASVHKGNAFVTWTAGGTLGTSRSVFFTTDDNATAHTNQTWEITPGASRTITYRTSTSGAGTAPTLPDGNAGDVFKVQVFYENETSTAVETLYNATTAPANGTSWTFTSTSSAGVYRIYAQVLNQTVGVTDYNVNTDGTTGDDTDFHKGALRVGMAVTSITVSDYPASTKFAYGATGDESATITVNHTVPKAVSNTEDVRINTRQNSNQTLIENGTTKDAGTGGSTTQAFVIDSSYDDSLLSYDGELEIVGASALLATEKWTHVASVTAPVVQDSATVARRATLFNADATITMSTPTIGQTVYNRGESSTHSFTLTNARSEQLTRSMTWTMRDASNATVTTASGTGATYSKTYSIGSSDTAAATSSGNQWSIITTKGDAHNVSANIFSVSSLLTVDNIWHATATGDATEATQFFIGADNMQVKTHVDDVRGNNKASATVACSVIDPDGNTNGDCDASSSTTGADGYTGFTKITPEAPSGTWTLRATATDASGNATSGNVDETVTYVSPYTAKYALRTVGWNQEYNKGDTATFTIQAITKDASDDWSATNVDSGTTPYYEIQYWDGSAWQTSVSRTNMTASVSTHTWTASFSIPNTDAQVGRKYAVSFNARLGGAQIAQLKEFAVVQATAGDPITVVASPTRAIANDTVRLTIRESNLDATVRTGNASGTEVYVYDPNNTAQVNGSSPTELGNGVYYYNYALGSSPTNGVWQVVVTTDNDVYSAATNFQVGTELAKESTSQTIKTNTENIESKVNTIRDTTDTIKTNTENLQTDVTDIQKKLKTLQTTTTALSTDLDNILAHVQGLSLDDDALATVLNGLTTKLLVEKVREPIVQVFYTTGSLVVNILVTNPPDSSTTKVAIKEPLPKEVRPEHVLEAPEELAIDYDPVTGAYVATSTVDVPVGQSVKLAVRIEDVWRITDEELNALEEQSDLYYEQLTKTTFAAQGLVLRNDIQTKIRAIRSAQAIERKPEEKIINYRENIAALETVKGELRHMSDLTNQVSDSRSLKGFVGGVQTVATWGIVVAVVTGIGLLTFVIFRMWQYQTAFMAMQLGITPQGLATLGLAGGVPRAPQRPTLPSFPSPRFSWSLRHPLPWKKLVFIGGAAVLVALGSFLVFFFLRGRSREVTQPTTEPLPALAAATPEITTPSPNASPVSLPTPIIEVKATPTGWLRVRTAPDLTSEEITKINVGEQLPYEEERDGWYHVTLPDGQQGWIFGEYVEKIIAVE